MKPKISFKFLGQVLNHQPFDVSPSLRLSLGSAQPQLRSRIASNQSASHRCSLPCASYQMPSPRCLLPNAFSQRPPPDTTRTCKSKDPQITKIQRSKHPENPKTQRSKKSKHSILNKFRNQTSVAVLSVEHVVQASVFVCLPFQLHLFLLLLVKNFSVTHRTSTH